MRLTTLVIALALCLGPHSALFAQKVAFDPTPSQGTCRLMFADGTSLHDVLSVFEATLASRAIL